MEIDGCLATRKLQEGGPEQGMEIDDVLANEMNLLGIAFGVQQGRKVDVMLLAVCLERGQIADGGVQPDIKVFAGCIGDGNAVIGLVAGNVPVIERGVAVFSAERLAC